MSTALDQIPLADLAGAIICAHEAATTAVGTALGHARHAGDLLKQAKSQMPHGAWLSWLQTNCPAVSVRTAQSYMRVASRWPEIEAATNTQHVACLPLRDALALLASHRAPIENGDGAADDSALAAMMVELKLLDRLIDAPNLTIDEVAAILRRAEEMENAAYSIRITALANVGRCLNQLEALGGAELVKVASVDPVAFAQACKERLAELSDQEAVGAETRDRLHGAEHGGGEHDEHGGQ